MPKFCTGRLRAPRPTGGACPDHYVIKTGRRGKQEVIEVTGGAALASRILVDYTDTAEVPIAADPKFGIQIAGCARNAP